MVDPKHPDWKVSQKLRSNARALRRDSTDVERILWSELRGNRLKGANFRRQVPIENHIVDFLCHAAKLVVELDGGQHFSDQGERADAARSAVIEARGFKILRFNNHRCDDKSNWRSPDNCRCRCGESPHPGPAPRAGSGIRQSS